MRRVRIIKIMGRRELQADREGQVGLKTVQISKVKGHGERRPLVDLIRCLRYKEVKKGGLGTSRGRSVTNRKGRRPWMGSPSRGLISAR